jgi:DNA invertase Pin-like site-specific DNA recombinase
MVKGTKIGMEAASEIRRRVLKGEAKRALAREFKVCPSTIRSICQFKTWVDHRLWRL